jgi:hypothetical protein
MHARTIALPCLAALGLAACTPPASGPVASRNQIYSTDLSGKAASCTAPDVALTQGKESTATIVTGGSGWCGIAVTMGGNAMTAGLLTQPARSGRVYVHTVGDVTRVDYTPSAGAGADSFAVQFIPGDEIMRVTVSAATAVHK